MAEYLNSKDPVVNLIRSSWESLESHPLNKKRRDDGLKVANSIWLWDRAKPRLFPNSRSFMALQAGLFLQ
jgi:2,3-bisphosphoglycerate-independent phosphoglycerate mutase